MSVIADVLPFYNQNALKVEIMPADNGTEFVGTTEHDYQLILELSDRKHRRIRVGYLHTNGFIERFNRTVTEEFFNVIFRKQLIESVE